MLLTIRSLVFFPIAFPQITRMITGRDIHDPKFQRDRIAFLKKFVKAFRPPPGVRHPFSTETSTPARNGALNGAHRKPRSKFSPRRTGILA
jgi:hypothetical protein